MGIVSKALKNNPEMKDLNSFFNPDLKKEWLQVSDIRNKLSPVVHLITMIESGRVKIEDLDLEQVKESVNYLAQRSVFSEI